MRLVEFSNTPLVFKDALAALSSQFQLQRVGGAARVYTVGQRFGVVFVVRGGPKAIGMVWSKGSKRLESIYVWNSFNADHSPDFAIDLPEGTTMMALPAIANFIENPHTGVISEAEAPAQPVDPQSIRDVRITARNAAGEMFVVPGSEETAKRLEKMYQSQRGSEKSMAEQYEELTSKVELVVSGRSHNIKSLLIYGAPSSGKTFTVMQTIKRMGLKEGVDYVVKKGSITDFAAYRTLIQHIDGLVIFDDCDSVVETKVGKNMIKGALDTYPVRDLSYDNANTIDTDSMTTEDRVVFVDAMSRVMRGTASEADIKLFDRYENDDKKKGKKAAPDDDVYRNEEGEFVLPDPDVLLAFLANKKGTGADRMHQLQAYFSRRLPNKIDYRGRMIFISNMGEDEWDSAILTRTFRQYMDFSDPDMLDFIESIIDHIDAPALNRDQKMEVLNYIRELYETGHLKSRVNFRLVQQGFDLRLTSNWKSMIADL